MIQIAISFFTEPIVIEGNEAIYHLLKKVMIPRQSRGLCM
jgi:hypothetical protein